MKDTVSSKVLGIYAGKEVCTITCRLPNGDTDSVTLLVSVLQRMTNVQALGAILDIIDGRTGGLSEMEKFYLNKNLRDYLMDITTIM